ncbi:MAG: AAA family ATPase, partial [Terriglobia bacterium]
MATSRLLPVDTHRLQSLLAQLVLKAGVAQSRQHLSFLFWPDSVESQARTNLRQLLHHFRSALPDIDRFLESGSQSLLWRKESEFSLDVMEFESSIAEARAAQKVQDQAKEQSCLEKAVGIYRGDLLPGFYEEWIEEERQRLKAQYEAALNRLLVILEGRRLIPAAIQHGEQLLRLDPLNETSVQHLMRLHALVGDLASTSRVYQQCVAVLQRELGVTPSPTTRRLLEKLMKPEAGPLVESPAEPRPPSPRLSLVGRQTELSRMQEVWNTVIEGQASFVLICGEPGIGKSRLLEEFTSWAASRNASTAYARCYVPEQHLSFAPVTQWLRSQAMLRALPKLLPVQLSELARVLPELLAEHPGLVPPQPFTENWQRRHFLEGMAQAVLNARQPLLLVLDDLQWCDQDTIDWIQFLLHFAPRMKLLIAATVRLDELGHSHPATRMLQQLQRDELVTQIVLQRLNLEQTSTLASEVSRQKLDVSSFAHLYQETEGNPLFVIESVRAGLVTAETSDESSGTNPDARPSRGLLPPKVHAVLSARLAQLSPPAHDLVGVAATIGRAFNFELLARASQHSEHSLAPLLDELWERQVIQCQKGEIYDFTHDKLREVAYAEMGPARQRLSHRSVAEALEAISVPDLDAVSSHLATHCALAGMHARAIPYYHLAAKLSQRVYADHEASQYL